MSSLVNLKKLDIHPKEIQHELQGDYENSPNEEDKNTFELSDFAESTQNDDEVTDFLIYHTSQQHDKGNSVVESSIEPEPDSNLTLNTKLHLNNIPLILFICWSGNFLCAVDGTIVSTTMNDIASQFNQAHLVTWIATSYLLTSTSFQPLYGKTSDILGRKELLLLAQILFTVGIFLSSISTNVQTLSISRAIAGSGGAGMLALTSIVISDLVSLSERSLYVGYGTIIYSTAQMIGGPLGGWMIMSIGWRFMFLFQVPLMLLLIVLLWRSEIHVDHITEKSERWSKNNLSRIDWKGMILLNVIVSILIFLLSLPLPFFVQIVLGFVLVCAVAVFTYVETYKAQENIIDFSILKGIIGALGLTNGINMLIMYVILFISPLYLQIVQDIPVSQLGFFTMFQVVSAAFGSLLAGYVIRQYNKSEAQTLRTSVLTSLTFLFVQAVGFYVLYALTIVIKPVDTEHRLSWIPLYLTTLAISGLGAGGYSVGIAIFVVGKVGKKGQASANTVVSLIRSLGNVTGVSLSLGVFSSGVKSMLSSYFKDKGPEEQDYISSLIGDSGFVKNGLPEVYRLDVLSIYKSATVGSFNPGLVLTAIGVVVMLGCYLNVLRVYGKC